jgi:hypothetical protein
VGASIPSLLAAGLVYLILTRLGPRRLAGPARP